MHPSGKGLSHGLKPRHVTMVSIAGVIGAGLFVGAGRAIAEAGPAALLAYAMAGLLAGWRLAKFAQPTRRQACIGDR